MICCGSNGSIHEVVDVSRGWEEMSSFSRAVDFFTSTVIPSGPGADLAVDVGTIVIGLKSYVSTDVALVLA